MGNDPSMFIIGVMAQVEAMLCVFSYFIHWFLQFFLSQVWEGRDQNSGSMNQSGAHMQQLNVVNAGQNIGGIWVYFLVVMIGR